MFAVRTLACISLELVALVAAASAQEVSSAGRDERASVQLAARVVFEGFVLDADGAPGAGTVVVSSAGGRTVVDANGHYRLEASVPRDAVSVELVAFGSAGGAKISVELAPATSTTRVDPLLLSPGAACEPGWLPTFARPGWLTSVEALAIYDDGRGPAVYLGGLGGIVRWDGSSSEVLEVGGVSPATVHALQVHDDGSGPALYAGGWFTTVGSVSAKYIAKYQDFGWSALGSGLNNQVLSLAVYDGGSGPALYAGGSFTKAGGAPASHIAKWGGSNWTTLGSGVNSGVQAMTVHDDGSGPALFVAGSFTSAGGVSGSNRIAKWNGSTWSQLGSGVNRVVYALTVFDDGSGPALYLGGEFTTAGAVNVSGVAKWNGSVWAAVGNDLNSGYGVHALTAYDDGGGAALYAGGEFFDLDYIAKWNGSDWTPLNGGTGGFVHALLAYDDGDGPVLLAGGTFDFADGVVVHSIAKWDGSNFEPLIPPRNGLSGRVETMAVFDDGSGPALYASGPYVATFGDVGAQIGRWNGSRWTPGLPGLGGGEVDTLLVFDDGSGPGLVASGPFTYAGSTPVNHIARWDGSNWAPLGGGVPPEASSLGLTLATFDDGSGPGLVACYFVPIVGVDVNRIARWDGASWTQLGGDFPHLDNYPNVYDMAAFDHGSGPTLYAGGYFTSAGGVAASNIAKWDGSSWAPLGSGTNGGVVGLQVFDDGSGPALFVTGGFTTAGGIPASGIAKWDGSSWSALASEPGGQPGRLTVFDDGSGPALYTSLVQGSTTDLARWDGSAWTLLASGIDGYPYAMTGFDDGERSLLYVGGQFTNTETGESYLSRWGCPLATIHRKTRVR